jgi:hypothetical protein
MKMKWNEAVFRALGEIEDDLIPPDTPTRKAEEKPDVRERATPVRKPRRRVLTAIGTAAAVLVILLGVTLLPRLTGLQSEKGQPNEPREPDVSAVGAEPEISAEREFFSYLPYLASRADEFIPLTRVMALPALPEADDGGQTVEAEDPETAALSPLSAFYDRNGIFRILVAGAGEEDDVLMRNLRRDLGYANFTRSYGCVLWKADWNRGEAEYLGVVPLLKREETEARLLAGEYVTAVPEGDEPGLSAETLPALVGRRTLVYLLSPAEEHIRLYECFFVRLGESEIGAPRWGLYYVPAADAEVYE